MARQSPTPRFTLPLKTFKGYLKTFNIYLKTSELYSSTVVRGSQAWSSVESCSLLANDDRSGLGWH